MPLIDKRASEDIMDHIDKKLLTILQDNARLPLKNIAEQVFLSSPAVSARIDKLEDDGIIRKYEAVLDYKKLGYNIMAFINVEVAPQKKLDFYKYIEECHSVLECNYVTGVYSMLMKVIFVDTQELDAFIWQLQQYGKTSTQIVFSTPIEPRGIDVNLIPLKGKDHDK